MSTELVHSGSSGRAFGSSQGGGEDARFAEGTTVWGFSLYIARDEQAVRELSAGVGEGEGFS